MNVKKIVLHVKLKKANNLFKKIELFVRTVTMEKTKINYDKINNVINRTLIVGPPFPGKSFLIESFSTNEW